MIDREARKAATSISEGDSAKATTNTKVAVYGLLSRALDPATLEGGLILERLPENFNELELALYSTLRKSAHKGFFDLDSSTRHEIHELLSRRIANARDSVGGLALTGLTRLIQGTGTGARTEVIALRTIAQKQATGEQVSEKGLYASAKAPFLAAMMHFNDLLIDRDEYERWPVLEGGDGGQVFRAADVTLDFNSGLRLINMLDDSNTTADKLAHGPQIGCPATFIRGYLHKVHEITTDTALEAKLLAAS